MRSIYRAVCPSVFALVLSVGCAQAQIPEEGGSSQCGTLGFAVATKGSNFITLGTSSLRPGTGVTFELATSPKFNKEIFSVDGVYNFPLSQTSMINGVVGAGFCFGWDMDMDDPVFGLSLSAAIQMRTGTTVLGVRWKSYHRTQAIGLTVGFPT